MKTTLYLISALFLAFAVLTSCDKAEELTEVDFEATYDADLEVDASSRDINGDFYAFASIDPTSDDDFRKYKDKIKNIEIISVSGQMLYLNKNFNLNASLSVASVTKEAYWSFNSFPVSQGTTLTLGNENGQWSTVKSIANEKAPYTVSISGNTDEDNLSFTIKVTIKYKVTAKAL